MTGDRGGPAVAAEIAAQRLCWLALATMLFTNGILTNDVLRWRLLGASVWQLGVWIAASVAWSAAQAPLSWLSPLTWLLGGLRISSWLTLASLAIAQAPAFAAQAAVLSTAEPRPLYLPRLCWTRLAGVSVVLQKLAARLASAAAAARTLSYVALHTLSAALVLSLDTALHGTSGLGATWLLLYAAWLATIYLLHTFYWSQDVLVFPSVQRHRYFRIKQRMPSAARRAVQLAAAAFAAAALTSALLGVVGSPTLSSDSSSGGSAIGLSLLPWAALRPAVSSLLAGSVCTFCWLMGAAALEVVLTERLRPDDYSDRDVLSAMAACLKGGRGPLMKDLALHDLCLLASADVGQAAWRRGEVWADDSGDRWRPLGEACLVELQSTLAPVAAALPQAAGGGSGAGAGGAGSQRSKWNVLPALSVKGSLSVSRPQAEALLALRCGYQRAALAARTLASLAVASLQEDRFGVLQMSQPGLGDVLLALLGGLVAVNQFVRGMAALGPRQLALGPWRGTGDTAAGAAGGQPMDAAALALQDTLTTSLYSVTNAFGEGLRRVLAEGKAPAVALASKSEAAALLERLLKAEE